MRNSSIELLRCVSIILIMMVHIGYMAFGSPTPEYIRTEPCGSFFYMLSQNVSNICVDIFILISGWFGIHAKWKSIGNLLFQCIYFAVLWGVACIAWGYEPLSLDSVLADARNFSLPYFIICYGIMYMFTPVLNAFLENTPPRQVRNFVILFFVIQSLFGWIGNNVEEFNRGNSAISFIGLYMLARYVRLHTTLPHYSAKFHFMCYLMLLIVPTIAIWFFAIVGVNDYATMVMISKLGAFSSPFTIGRALFLLLLFSRFSFISKFINWMGASSFAAVLLHGNYRIFPEKWTSMFVNIYETNSLAVYLSIATGILLGTFVLSIILDQPRKWIWELIIKNNN